MLSKIYKVVPSKDFKSKEKSIEITKVDIDRLNSKIREDIKQYEDERLKGLDFLREINKMQDFEELER